MMAGANPAQQMGQQEPTGDAKIPNKEVLSHYVPFSATFEKDADLREMLGNALAHMKPLLPYAGAGAVIGAGMGAGEAYTSNEPLKQRISELETEQDPSLAQAMNLAQLRARATVGDYTQRHPIAAMGAGALMGASMGAAHGPRLGRLLQRSGQDAGEIVRGVKSYL